MSNRVVLASTLLGGAVMLGAVLQAQGPPDAYRVHQTPSYRSATVLNATVTDLIADGSVTGRVTDARSGQPLADVTVTVQGTQIGATTAQNGTYRIARVPSGTHTITARRIGYGPVSKSVDVPDGGTTTVDFALQTSVINLEQVVVTGTAGNQTRVAQGAVVATVDAEDITAKAPVSTVTDVLSGRVAGVNVTEASGTIGASPRINIRGATSISLSNAPLVFVDGVRVSSGERNDVGNYHSLEGLGGQSVTALNDINPDDIASIEVVKGPAAATLYGADASAGVIQIITKKGRLGAKSFTQNLHLEWDQIQPNFTPQSIYGTCGASDVKAGGPDLCQGKTAGTAVSINPLVRDNVFSNGRLGSLEYNAQGGGENFGYFVSGSANNETGTEPSNYYIRRTARTSFNWVASPMVNVDATVGFSRNDYRVPEGDDANYGYLTQQYAFGSPFAVTVGPNGVQTGGLGTPVAGLAAINNELTTVRYTPSTQINYNPFNWLTNRLTVGADIAATHGVTFFPKNDQNWYNGDQANGYVEDIQNPVNIYTVDYLGDIRTKFHSDKISSDLSFGSQYINTANNYLAGVGLGLATNASNLVSSAATTEGYQNYSQAKSLGFLAQEQLGFGETLYLQAGARVDRNSAFGQSYGSIFLPKVSASYVISNESFWKRALPMVSTMRLRAAFGSTGRSPTPGASLRTYAPFTYVNTDGTVGPGVIQASPGNTNLEPERGTEFEGGFDAGFFNERLGIELTYYNKHTSDLLLQNPLPPSLAYTTNPFINAGKVDNSGLEFTLRATPIDRKNLRWDATFTGSTLKNKLVSLGPIVIPPVSEISSDLTSRYVIGKPLGSWYSSKIIGVDTAGGFATVTNTPVYDGSQLPTFQGNFSSTFTVFHNLQLYGLFTSQHGGTLLNVTPLYLDLTGESKGLNLPAAQGGYTKAEQLERFGPFKTQSGQPGPGLVLDNYLQPTDFVRLQELSATITLPSTFARSLRTSGASITAGGRNLHLWKNKAFDGPDPEVISNTTIGGNRQFESIEEFTVPPTRRWFVKLNLQF